MATMQALLKIKADVEGEGQVNALGRAIGGLSNTAGKVSGGLKGLAGAAGGLSGVLGNLIPVGVGAGLIGIAQSAINAADNMNDLSQKTGVSVESLSKFQQAANASGTSIEGVGAAMIKLNKGLAAGDAGPAAEALKTLGLSATDASGKLKSTDTIMLEVADKFAKMPDGAQKTAVAMQLFGKAGADMIPMLNGGAKSIENLKATMSTGMAESADRFNDKIEGLKTKAGELGLQIGTLLMPYLEKFVDLLTAASVAFGNLPGPLQAFIGGVVALAAAFVVLAPAISAVISIAGALAGLQLGATIAGWLGAVGPAIAGITAAFSGLLAWIGSTLIPGLLAFFSGPVGWTVLAVAAVVAMAIAFRKPLTDFITWLWNRGKPIREFWIGLWDAAMDNAKKSLDMIGRILDAAGKTWTAVLYQVFVRPWIATWDTLLRDPVSKTISWINGAWAKISAAFNAYVVAPIRKAWEGLTQLLPKAMENVAKTVKGVFDGIANGVKSVIRSVLQFIASNINKIGAQVNKLIGAFNRLPGPNIPFVPTLSVPAFAQGGIVRKPTLALVGEGGESEYIIPASKAAGFAMNYLNGARGGEAIPAYAQGGYVGSIANINDPAQERANQAFNTRLAALQQQGRLMNVAMRPVKAMEKAAEALIQSTQELKQANQSFSAGSAAPTINISTGPVTQFDGKRYVTLDQFEKGMQQVADSIYKGLRKPSTRVALALS